MGKPAIEKRARRRGGGKLKNLERKTTSKKSKGKNPTKKGRSDPSPARKKARGKKKAKNQRQEQPLKKIQSKHQQRIIDLGGLGRRGREKVEMTDMQF